MLNDTHKRPRLFVIGTGPGDLCYMAPRALELLNQADSIAGYTTYIDLIRPVIKDKQIISTGMTKEVERVEKAIFEALSGKACALVSGGDSGIYAMAGLVFELCQKKGLNLVRYPSETLPHAQKNTLEIEIVPGIPALAAGASLVGAPLTHDFAVISLSDLLTPWETIEKRLHAAAMADFVIAIYNPKSKKRDWQLARAREIIAEYRDPKTPVGIVTSAMREQQQVTIVCLGEMDKAQVNMQTVLFVGNSASTAYLDFMYTPRGYSKKYAL
ncbi:MAG: precorrin-3B C(17)-methyltransferase [Proteobacteria bacterium]|nr:precorrin-3B C(17)-methyltransferase [Desulfobacula sp.]MBU3951322.1 precorrin-3B C(17)-methyltransferase [Pseudomonadota bacterium]MBU4130365.1 precorrin-3B C(17)-methyltransferase [Pseudomonadota bacterium]